MILKDESSKKKELNDKSKALIRKATFRARKDGRRSGGEKKENVNFFNNKEYAISIDNEIFTWTTKAEKIAIIRTGLPYGAIDSISKRTKIPVKHYLNSLEIVQTTYNKKKNAKENLSKQDSEFILILTELYDFGIRVFNDEKEKFQRWLKKSNISLGGVSPDSLFDSLTGIQEVKNCLSRLEYGNLA